MVKTMCGSDEPHSYPERSSPTRMSTSGHASYKRAIVYRVIQETKTEIWEMTVLSEISYEHVWNSHWLTTLGCSKLQIQKHCEW
jgi:hypothetical protein